MPNQYRIASGYISRPEPQYFHDTGTDIIYQPDVYHHATRIARDLNANRIVDVGCGVAKKLVACADQFEVVGVDYGANLTRCQELYSDIGTWIEADLEAKEALPLAPEMLAGAVLVCADVVEHVRHPSVLLLKLSQALQIAPALVISTPERELTYGSIHPGPPRNAAHAREWSIREFASLMRLHGFYHGTIGLTTSNNRTSTPKTILGVYVRDEQHLEIVEDALIDQPRPSEQKGALLSGASDRRPLANTRMRHIMARVRKGRFLNP
jgi:Methyltransferase domain